VISFTLLLFITTMNWKNKNHIKLANLAYWRNSITRSW
jgi:hypothetical protein